MDLRQRVRWFGWILRLMPLASVGILLGLGLVHVLSMNKAVNEVVFDAGAFETHESPATAGLYPFRPEDGTIRFVSDAGATIARFVATEHGTQGYNGMVLLRDLSAPPDAVVEIQWRVVGVPQKIGLHFSEKVAASKAQQGEDFIYEVPEVGNQWQVDRVPLQQFQQNQWQPPDTATDGVFQTESMGNMIFGLSPGALVSLDIHHITLSWHPDGLMFLVFLGLIGVFAVLLLFRTSTVLLALQDSSIRLPRLALTRIGFFLQGLILLWTWVEGPRMANNTLVLVLLGLGFAWFALADFIPHRFLSHKAFRYSNIPLFALVLIGVPSPPYGVLILGFLGMLLPALVERDRVSFLILMTGTLVVLPFHPRFGTPSGILFSWLGPLGIGLSTFGVVEFFFSREARQTMDRALSLYQGVFHFSSDAIFTLDRQGRILNANEAFETLTGRKGAQLIGEDIRQFVAEEDQSKFAQGAPESATIQRFDARLRSHEGTWLDVFVSEHPILERGSLTGYQVIATDFTERRKLEEELRKTNERLEALVHLDSLTGINNRRFLDAQLETEWRRCQRSQLPLSLIMIDIDHFKRYNDTYGHQKGDECLTQVARCLQGALGRAGDLVVRYGGEEFVALLPATDLEAAVGVAEHLQASVQALGIPHQASPVKPWLTLSLGVATVSPQRCPENLRPEDLLSLADDALYRAKNQGRNQIVASVTPGN